MIASGWTGFLLGLVLSLLAVVVHAGGTERIIAPEPGTTLTVSEPEAGETVYVQIAPGQVVHLPSDSPQAEMLAEGDDLVFLLPGDRKIVLKGLLRPDLLDSGILLVAGGASIPATELARHALIPLEVAPAAGPPEPGHPSDRIVQTGRSLLFSLESEEPGYALYSYVLFRRNDSAGINFDRRAAAVDGYLAEVDEASRLEAHGIDRADINILYLPVEPFLTDGATAEKMREHASALAREEQRRLLLEKYDFIRARLMLDGLRLEGEGPYIVTYPEPLPAGRSVERGRLMVQDLSRVPPDLIRLWVIEFKRQIAGHRGGGDTLRPFLLVLRTEIANIARGFSVTREAVAGFIEFAE